MRVAGASPGRVGSAVECRRGDLTDHPEPGVVESSEASGQHGGGKRLEVVEAGDRVERETVLLSDREFARNGSDATGDRCHQNPGQDGVRGISADHQVRTPLPVGRLAPPELASGYHHFSQGSSLIDSVASALARRMSSSE